MSEKQNPDVVIDAITNTDKTYNGITINTPTIRRYAYLEKLKSPFVFGDVGFELENVVPSIYVLAATKDELKVLSGKSIDEIKDIATDPTNSAQIRLNACDMIIRNALKLNEQVAFAERLSAIEARLAE